MTRHRRVGARAPQMERPSAVALPLNARTTAKSQGRDLRPAACREKKELGTWAAAAVAPSATLSANGAVVGAVVVAVSSVATLATGAGVVVAVSSVDEQSIPWADAGPETKAVVTPSRAVGT